MVRAAHVVSSTVVGGGVARISERERGRTFREVFEVRIGPCIRDEAFRAIARRRVVLRRYLRIPWVRMCATATSRSLAPARTEESYAPEYATALNCKNPVAMTKGATSVYIYQRNGETLMLTQVRTHSGPSAAPATIKLMRVE